MSAGQGRDVQFDEDRANLEHDAEHVLRVHKVDIMPRAMHFLTAGRTLQEHVDDVRKYGIHFTPDTLRNSVLGGIQVRRAGGQAENIIKVGCACFGVLQILRYYCLLLERLGIDYGFLRKEYCCLAPHLYRVLVRGEDRAKIDELAREFQSINITQAREQGAKSMIFFCHWCALRNKWFFPNPDINLYYAWDILTQPGILDGKRLHLDRKVGYFAGTCHRLGTYVADKSVDLNWADYRALLDRIDGLRVLDIPHYCCQRQKSFKLIWEWVNRQELDTVVVACTPCYGNFIRNAPSGIKIRSLGDILLESLGWSPW